ncbi:hypothetical protein BGZ76_007752, partial [Entomortierella beljakovae]
DEKSSDMSMSTALDISASSIDMDSIGSGKFIQKKGNRSWGWAIKNKWAERIESRSGITIRCLYPGCRAMYQTNGMTTSGINNHLTKIHHITKDSATNDGSLSREGPLDKLLHLTPEPTVFDPTKFDDMLVRFIVRTKQPFSIVKSNDFQELLNHARMASIDQIKLPSDDSVASK